MTTPDPITQSVAQTPPDTPLPLFELIQVRPNGSERFLCYQPASSLEAAVQSAKEWTGDVRVFPAHKKHLRWSHEIDAAYPELAKLHEKEAQLAAIQSFNRYCQNQGVVPACNNHEDIQDYYDRMAVEYPVENDSVGDEGMEDYPKAYEYPYQSLLRHEAAGSGHSGFSDTFLMASLGLDADIIDSERKDTLYQIAFHNTDDPYYGLPYREGIAESYSDVETEWAVLKLRSSTGVDVTWMPPRDRIAKTFPFRMGTAYLLRYNPTMPNVPSLPLEFYTAFVIGQTTLWLQAWDIERGVETPPARYDIEDAIRAILDERTPPA